MKKQHPVVSGEVFERRPNIESPRSPELSVETLAKVDIRMGATIKWPGILYRRLNAPDSEPLAVRPEEEFYRIFAKKHTHEAKTPPR